MNNVDLPVGTKLVQLFSNFVCEHIPELQPVQITTFIVALTSTALPMDEFCLYMLAKQVQDTTAVFSAEQIVTIARRYADKALEDEEFFTALALRATSCPFDFNPAQLAHLLLSCAKIRFLYEDLCSLALPIFENPAQV